MERKMATIRMVSSIQPIENADAIEMIQVDGWQCVAKKEEFAAGDKCVYIEIDAIVPDIPTFEFMRPRRFRVKTVKLRGQISQGLALPLKFFEDLKDKDLELDTDVTELLGIKKYEPPEHGNPNSGGMPKGNFPGFIRKTDQERVQNLGKYFNIYLGRQFEITEKIDGQSITVYYRRSCDMVEGEFGICSRNWELKDNPDDQRYKLIRGLGIEEALKKLDRNIALQGEFYGEGVQKNRLQLKGQHFRVFDIFDIDQYAYFPPGHRWDLLKEMGLLELQIPVVGMYTMKAGDTPKTLLDMSEDKSVLNKNVMREGIVFKSMEHLDYKGSIRKEIVSFKAINNQYLLKYED